MKCRKCGEEIVLAEVCPYCGTRVEKQDASTGSYTDDRDRKQEHSVRKNYRPRGTFRGRVDSVEAEKGTLSKGRTVATLVRYLLDRAVPSSRKYLMLLAALYILVPLDIMPDWLIGLGWLDDAAVAMLLWRYITSELSNYRKLR